MTQDLPVPAEEPEEDDERYSFRCDCGASVSPGQALRGGKVICTCCGEHVPLPGAESP
jgi:hypothetical protein